jgi:hypothetical protein
LARRRSCTAYLTNTVYLTNTDGFKVGLVANET